MQFTWGFILLLLVVIIPGLIARRFYYHGEFSRQFGINEQLLRFVFWTLITGSLIVVPSAFLYIGWTGFKVDLFIKEVQWFADVDPTSYNDKSGLKYFNNPIAVFKTVLVPFLLITYGVAAFLGYFFSRLVSALGLDTRWKILRFNNFWFYLFSEHHSKIKKFHHFKQDSETRFLLTQADILVDTSSGTRLYSGVVVDYHLQKEDPQQLSKIILRETNRYTRSDDGITNPVQIPGQLFIVDCSKMLNLNLSHIYEEVEKETGIKSLLIPILMLALSSTTFFVLLFPLKVFETIPLYKLLFDINWFQRLLFAFAGLSLFANVINPYVPNKENEFEYKTWKEFWNQVIGFLFLVALAVIISAYKVIWEFLVSLF